MSRPEYSRRTAHFEALLAAGAKRLRLLANARLATFVALIGCALWAYGGSALGLASFVAAAAGFVLLIRIHDRDHQAHARHAALLEINRAAIDRLEDRWHAFPDNGQSFVSADHPFSGDLDVFGQGSLYQWCSTAVTAWGRKRLAAALSAPPRTVAEIMADQEAIRELAPHLDWRQDFQAEGLRVMRKTMPPEELVAWGEDETPLISRGALAFYRVMPVVTLAAIGAAYFGFLTWTPATLLMIAQLGLYFRDAKRVFQIANQLRTHGEGIEVYRNMVATLEAGDFRTERLLALRTAVSEPSAGASIRSLSAIVAWLEVQRIGILHFVLNATLLWDFQFVGALQAWRARNGRQVRRWLATVAEAEMLTTLAGIAHDHPEWCYPVFDDAPAVIGKHVGHPLIPNHTRITNEVTLGGEAPVLVITGSNMSGKSTYMRTVGINLVLAYAGAPVCAERVQTARFTLVTSMRNADNLEKNVSSFYAELLRVKMIVEAARRSEPVLFLIDEIFRGTNSADRHSGAVTVLRTLRDAGAVGMVSTHDLELGNIGDTEPKFRSAHFSESYEGDRIVFDHRIRPGVSQTRNATHLMRLVGIL